MDPGPGSAPPPVTIDAHEPGGLRSGVAKALSRSHDASKEDWSVGSVRDLLHELADQSQRHRTQRIGTDASGRSTVVSDADEGGSLTSVTPAASVGQLQAQIARLIEAFRAAEGRDPTADDSEFWRAYKTLTPRLGRRLLH